MPFHDDIALLIKASLAYFSVFAIFSTDSMFRTYESLRKSKTNYKTQVQN